MIGLHAAQELERIVAIVAAVCCVLFVLAVVVGKALAHRSAELDQAVPEANEWRDPTDDDPWAAEENPRDHDHEAAYETATRPTPAGAITVTEHCDCGAPMRSYMDWII